MLWQKALYISHGRDDAKVINVCRGSGLLKVKVLFSQHGGFLAAQGRTLTIWFDIHAARWCKYSTLWKVYTAHIYCTDCVC